MRIDLSNTITMNDAMLIVQRPDRNTIYRWRKNQGLEEHIVLVPTHARHIVRVKLVGFLKWCVKHDKGLPGLKEWLDTQDDEITKLVRKTVTQEYIDQSVTRSGIDSLRELPTSTRSQLEKKRVRL